MPTRAVDIVLRLLKGSLPCLLLAAIPVWWISLRVPLPRRDRLALLLLLYAVYALVFLCLHVGLTAWRQVIARRRGQREQPAQPNAAGFVWEYFLMAGLLLTNGLHGAFGYKNTIVEELSWLMARGPVAQLLLLAGGWTALFLVFRFMARHAGTTLGSVRAERFAMAVILVASLSCVALPGPVMRAATAGKAFAAVQAVDPTVEPAPRRPLVLLGLDGVDWRLLRAAIRTGRLETLEELVRDGFTSSLDNDGLGLSPVVWTAIATGKSMQRHGIFDFDLSRSPFFERPIESWLRYSPSEFAVWRVVKVLHRLGLAHTRLATGADRQGPSVWQILSRHNYRNLVVNYLTSFPAEKINGVFLAGHIYEATLLRTGDTSGSPSNGGKADGFEYPVGLLDRSYSHIKPVGEGPKDVISIAEREFNFLAPLTLEILKENSFHFVTFYTAWPDSFNHELSVEDYEMMLAGRYDRPLTRRFLEVYERLDDFVADIRRAMPDANLVLVSDHGVGPGYQLRRKILQHDKSQGIFIAHGPDVIRGTRSEAVSMCDITPTVLFYFDVPVAGDFDGTVVRQVFALPQAPREIPSYDPLVPNARVESSLGELDSVRERLKALGYIE